MSLSSTNLPTSTPTGPDCELASKTLDSNDNLQYDYQNKIAGVQLAMGLQSDDWMFCKIKVAVAVVARKFDLRPCSGPLNVESAKDGKSLLSLKLNKAAWWVWDRIPVGPNYQSLREPIQSLLEIRRSEIDNREVRFRERNTSTATLPDFDRLLELEEQNLQEEHL
ncbi:hypothetical protein BKA70DRAFT_1431629 [Coprinopsis sp. MPI-PUGE-AT-0042]|nr:hypothetical protein BKA70DRAFT_1435928 [Coprinopsis sp. MPI-PUGE-AT-0042]KAH6905052.1 hypothetical protein BKA70DRAFT_1431629 [Coprinopsis sp. MPI-PUGE-AT-0042]